MSKFEEKDSTLFYEVQGVFAILSGNEIKFHNPKSRRFIEKNPIIARDKAFKYYEDYIEGIVACIKDDVSPILYKDKILIKHFEEVSKKLLLQETNGTKSEPFFIRLGIYFYHGPKPSRNVSEKEFNEYYGLDKYDHIDFTKELGDYPIPKFPIINPILIHGISLLDGKVIDSIKMVHNLHNEYNAYIKYSYDIKDLQALVEIHGTDIKMIDQFEILKTPYGWENMYLEEEFDLEWQPVREILPKTSPTNLIISRGESKTVEFKRALLTKSEKGKIILRDVCRETICAFLNTEGGTLLIGVNDDGTIQGIDADLSLFQTNNLDSLKKLFDDMMKIYFPIEVADYLDVDIEKIDGKTILKIIVQKSNEPVFLYNRRTTQNIMKEFHIRRVASNEKLHTDIEQLLHYYRRHWKQ